MRAHVGRVTKDTWREHMHYAYDDFYFLTDPDEFIYQLRADDRRMQLLWTPISLEQFERTPYVYSGFFNNGLEFDRPMQAVLHTDNTGIAEVKLRGWNDLAKDTAFAYELWFADRERSNDAEFHGAKLQRFVLHSILDGQAMFRVQVPTPGSYVLRLSIEENDEAKKTRLLHFLCAFKVVCQTLACDVHPLPSCASGEWGPSMGERHFGLKAMTHITGVVSVDNNLEMKFGLPRKLHFLCKLRMNGVEDSTLEKFVSFSVCDDVLTVKVNPPQAGQYGLDFYAKPEDVDHDTFVHVCQYLLNVTRVVDTITIPLIKTQSLSCTKTHKWGPNELFQQIGMRAVSHTDPTINKTDASALVIEMGLSEAVKLSYNLTREPDEDCRSVVSMKDHGKKVKFSLSLVKPGNYLFAVYARKKKDSDCNMANVYSYMIKYALDETLPTLKRKKGLFSRSVSTGSS